jgi:hypothetical protein
VLIRRAAVLLVVVLSVSACGSETPHERKIMAEIISSEMYVEVESALSSQTLRASRDRSTAARGNEGGYRRAVVLQHLDSDCDPHGDAVDCGAKVEIFRTAARAESRMRVLDSSDDSRDPESRTRAGAVVLRVNGRLAPDDRAEYRLALGHALDTLPERLRHKAGLTSADVARLLDEAG